MSLARLRGLHSIGEQGLRNPVKVEVLLNLTGGYQLQVNVPLLLCNEVKNHGRVTSKINVAKVEAWVSCCKLGSSTTDYGLDEQFVSVKDQRCIPVFFSSRSLAVGPIFN